MYICIAMPNREAHCKQFFERLEVTPVYVSPVDKNSVDIQNLEKKDVVARKWVRRSPIPAASRKFEIACALSHMAACKAIVESKCRWAFVFEDDNIIGEDCISRFKKIVCWAEENHDDFHLINISPCNSLHTFRTGLLEKNQGCTNALLYSQAGAQYVVDNLLPLKSPIDDWLHLNIPRSYCVHKRIFSQYDSTAPLTLKTLLNPVYRKKEYLCNVHLMMVVASVSSAMLSVVWWVM